MNHDLFFIIVVVVSIILDFVVFARNGKELDFKAAVWQSVFWIAISLLFGIYVGQIFDKAAMIQYYTAYLMEKSLSVDNIFVFLIIFKTFKIPSQYINKTLLFGILIAIVLRVVFIILGVELLQKFEWLLYIFGLILLVTGYQMFVGGKDEENDPREGRVYKTISRLFRVSPSDGNGSFTTVILGKRYLTQLGLIVLLLGATDFVFALDSLPTVLAISQNTFVVVSSNVFAVLGLRALFYLLKNTADKFEYLQQGIAFILIFIGAKIIVQMLGLHIPEWVSLSVVIASLGGSIFYSNHKQKKES